MFMEVGLRQDVKKARTGHPSQHINSINGYIKVQK